MTREESARILDPETSIETFHEYANYRRSVGNYKWLEAVNEASNMGAAALRELDAQERAKTPCDLCRYNPPSSRDGEPCTMCPASPAETNMQNGCDFARQLGFSGCTKCPIDCDVRQAPKEESI